MYVEGGGGISRRSVKPRRLRCCAEASSAARGVTITMRPDGNRSLTLPSGVIPTNFTRTVPAGNRGAGPSDSLGKTSAVRVCVDVDVRLDVADEDPALSLLTELGDSTLLADVGRGDEMFGPVAIAGIELDADGCGRIAGGVF